MACTKLKNSLYDVISQVPLPKKALLVNFRLGVFRWILQIFAIAVAMMTIYMARFEDFPPSIMEATFWSEAGDPGPEMPPHCANLSGYVYKYNHNPIWDYTPTSCRVMGPGEEFQKSLQEAYFITFAQDTITEKQRGEAACNLTAEQCVSSGNVFEPSTTIGGLCKCSKKTEYYNKNPEKRRMVFRHSFAVQASATDKTYRRGNSALDYHIVDPDEQIDRKMVTNILRTDGEPCYLDGKYQFFSGDGGDIGGTIEEWLACGDMGLDSQSDKTRSNHPDENMAPHLRTTGVLVALEMRYQNNHRGIDSSVMTVCDVYVQVSPAWNARLSTDYTTLDKKSNSSGVRRPTQIHHRRAYGVTFTFTKGGSFAYFSLSAFITGIVNAYVMIGIPLQIVGFVALYGIGVVSQIYQNVLYQKFSIFEQFHGLAARMMTSAMGFRALTDQWTTDMKQMRSMNYQDIEKRMIENFAHKMKAEGEKEATLQEDEVKKMAAVVFMGLNSLDDGEISMNEFVHACSSNEFVDSETMTKFFDEHKPHPIAQLLDPTRTQIKDINEKVRQRLSVLSGKRSAETDSVEDDGHA